MTCDGVDAARAFHRREEGSFTRCGLEDQVSRVPDIRPSVSIDTKG